MNGLTLSDFIQLMSEMEDAIQESMHESATDRIVELYRTIIAQNLNDHYDLSSAWQIEHQVAEDLKFGFGDFGDDADEQEEFTRSIRRNAEELASYHNALCNKEAFILIADAFSKFKQQVESIVNKQKGN